MTAKRTREMTRLGDQFEECRNMTNLKAVDLAYVLIISSQSLYAKLAGARWDLNELDIFEMIVVDYKNIKDNINKILEIQKELYKKRYKCKLEYTKIKKNTIKILKAIEVKEMSEAELEKLEKIKADGRYETIVKPMLGDIHDKYINGMSFGKIAKYIDISVNTLYIYRRKYKEFDEIFNRDIRYQYRKKEKEKEKKEKTDNYETKVMPKLKNIREKYNNGLTLAEIATYLDIGESTLYNYRVRHREFNDIFKKE